MAVTRHYLRNTQTNPGTGGTVYDLLEAQGSIAELIFNRNGTSYAEIGRFQITLGTQVAGTSFPVSVDIDNIDVDLDVRWRVQRINSSDVVQDSSGYSSVYGTSGIKTDTLTLTTTWAAGDRLALSIEGIRTGGHGNKPLDLSINDADSYVDPDVSFPDHNQRAFRIRDTDPAINGNTAPDWVAAENTDASIFLDSLFRLRFEVEETESVGDGGITYKLQFRVNTGGGYGSWADVPVGVSVDTTPLGATWPVTAGTDDPFTEHFGVMIVAGTRDGVGFANDAVTTDILTTTTGSFVSGAGMHDNLSPSITLNGEQTELEWPVVISRWYDGAGGAGSNGRKYDDGDTFEFRVVESDGTAFTGDTNSGYDNVPEVTAADRPGHIGATHIEEPDHVGPFIDGNGNMYYISEYTPVSHRLLLQKSTDGGEHWNEATVTGRPTTDDPEGVDIFQEGDDILHIITHRGSDLIEYHEYFMSSHGTPDTWNTIDDQIDANAGNPAIGDGCSIIKRPSDGKIFVFYMGLSGTATIWYTDDNGDGTWQTWKEVDTTANRFSGTHAVLNPDTSDIWFFYMDQDNLDIYVQLLADGQDDVEGAGGRDLVASVTFDVNAENNTLRAVYYDDGGVEVIFATWHHRNGGDLNEYRTMRDGTLQTAGDATEFDVERSGGGGHSGVADLGLEGKKVHIIYSRLSDNDIWHGENDDEGGFGSDVERNDAVTCLYIRTAVFTHSSGNGGDTVLGYCWEDGADGRNAGFLRYDELVLTEGDPSIHLSLVGLMLR